MKYNSLFELLDAFPDEESCVRHLENLRWPNGIVCPCCGSTGTVYRLERGATYKCADCRKQFSVRKDTIFEESRLPLRKWFAASWLLTSNRKCIPSTQLAREIGVTQKRPWFMLCRLREVAATIGGLGGPLDGTVETDETYIGGKEKNKHASKKQNAGRGTIGKMTVMGVVERNGRIRTALIEGTTKAEIHKFIGESVTPDSTVYSDDHASYEGLDGYQHESVNHSGGEYVRGDVNTNTMESAWALLKRGHYGIYHKMSAKHLHRYLAEFDARWIMGDICEAARLDAMLESSPGLRLTYEGLIA